jgi:hypothetical protein
MTLPFNESRFDELHEEAMALAEQGDRDRKRGDAARARALYAQALQQELQALSLVAPDAEPSRAVMLRSAASLAFDAQDPDTAWRLLEEALASKPPAAIRRELEELQETLIRYEFEAPRPARPPWQGFRAVDDADARSHRAPRAA